MLRKDLFLSAENNIFKFLSWETVGGEDLSTKSSPLLDIENTHDPTPVRGPAYAPDCY